MPATVLAVLATAAAVACLCHGADASDVSLNTEGTELVFSEKFLQNLVAARNRQYGGDAGSQRRSRSRHRRFGLAQRDLEVNTTSGEFLGMYMDGVAQWRGIPYGSIPGRFERSVLAPYNSNLTNATDYGPACLQGPENGILPGSGYVLPNQAEDCLTVTVTAPRFACGRKLLPIVIRASGDTPSSGAVEIDDLSRFSERSSVVVFEFNFRTGFVALPVLEGFEDSMANLHFYDQQVLVNWVVQNAYEFGGNPNKITFACPHSRGGADCIAHLADNSGTPAPKRVILEEPSSYRHFDLPFQIARTREWAAASPRFCNQTAASDVRDCLKSLTVQDLTDTSGLAPTFSPLRATLVPGTPFEKQPWEIIASGNYNKDVRFMVGYPNATGTPYGLAIPLILFEEYVPFANMTFAQFQQYVFAYFAFRVEYGIPVAINITSTYGALAQQPGQNFGTALSQAVQDSGYHCFTNWLIKRLAQDGVKVYGFVYEHDPDMPSNPFAELVGNPGYGSLTQAFYSSAGQGNFNYHLGFSDFEHVELFPRVQQWISNFVYNGKPREDWVKYNTNGEINLIDENSVFDTQMVPLPTGNAALCEIWGELIPQDVPPTVA